MARVFDASSSQYIAVTASPVVTLPISVSLWIKIDDNPPGEQCAFYYGDSSTGNHWLTIEVNSSGQIRGWGRDTGVSVTTATDYVDGTWHNVVIAYYVAATLSTLQLYVDGNLIGTNDSVNSSLIGNFDVVAVGMRRDSSPTAPITGTIAELSIYDSQLGQTEASILAAGFSSLFVAPESLVLYTPLIRDNDNDLVGGLSLAASNSPTIGDHVSILNPVGLFTGIPTAIPPVGVLAGIYYRTLLQGTR